MTRAEGDGDGDGDGVGVGDGDGLQLTGLDALRRPTKDPAPVAD